MNTEVDVRTVRSGVLTGLAASAAVLAVIAATAGLDAAGWAVGAGCALGTDALLVRGLRRRRTRPGPADLVTRLRAALAGGVAALAVDAGSAAAIVTLAAIALVLDGVDGWLARRTGTASELGARFDMEVDAFLIFVLSLRVAQDGAPWALLIGLARYAYVAAWPVAPWLRKPVPPRFWRKTVAAVQGIVLAVAIAGVLTARLTEALLGVALMLLIESFGRDVVWLWRHERRPAPPSRPRAVVRWVSTALGAGLVWFALLAPDRLDRLHLLTFVRIPVEALVVAALALVLPRRSRAALAIAVGSVLGTLLLLRVLDLGFTATIDRPFNPVADWGSLQPAVGVLRDSVGNGWTNVALAVAVLAVVAVPVAAGAAVLRLTTLAARHRRQTARALVGLGLTWAVAAAVGAPLASGNAARAVYAEGRAVDTAIADEQQYSQQLRAVDPMRYEPANHVLSALHGKDVLVVFIESYGKVAMQDSWFSPEVDAELQQGTAQLQAAGYGARSAFLTSPTFGGVSWLAHSTLQSGTWVDNPLRYDQLMSSNRYTLSDAFHRGGWRTVVDVPSNHGYWPQGHDFYHFDQQYGATDVGYAGAKFSYASVPDQYTFAKFRQDELLPAHRRPVMAEIDLVSSHTPWAPLPRMVPWSALGDGSVYGPMAAAGPSPTSVWASAHSVQDYYGQSIRYSWAALISFLRTYADPNLVLVVLGDHQPAKVVSGENASHDVPISVITADPKVLGRISGWGWPAGLLPPRQAPVWRMDAFRNRFLEAYSG